MERLKGGIFITSKEIQLLTNCHPQRARYEHLQIRDALGKTNRCLTVKEYCDYKGLNMEEVVAYLNQYRH